MSHKKWQVLKSIYALKTPYLKVRLDTCKTNQGQKIDYYVIEKSDSVGIVALTPDKKIVLERQYRHPIKKWVYQIPAGHIDKGENSLQAIKRELLEESGYQAQKMIKLNTVYSGISKHAHKLNLYLGLRAIKVNFPNPDLAEDIETYLIDLDQAVEMVKDNKIEDMDSAYAIMAAHQYLRDHPQYLWTMRRVNFFCKRAVGNNNMMTIIPNTGLLGRYIITL